MSLDKKISRILNISVSEPLSIDDNTTGVYANQKWVDETGKRVIIYYYSAPHELSAKRLGDFIKVNGETFEIEYWKKERPSILSDEEKKEMYKRVKKPSI